MPRPRLRLLALGLATATTLVTGCSANSGVDREPGDPVTAAEADALAALLHRNFGKGGADFVVNAPFGTDALLTLTGDIDFRHSMGRAEAVTTFGDGSPGDTRTVFFTARDIWFGDVPGLPAALAADGAEGATYLRRPIVPADADDAAPLVDVLVEVLLNLAARTADDPQAFLDGTYTWQGQRSIDSRLTSLFRLREGRTVAVGASDDLLTQFVTRLPAEARADDGAEVTVTLSGHGTRRVDLPPGTGTVDAADHPAVAAQLGI